MKAAKEKTFFFLVLIASALFACAPSLASSTHVSTAETRAELFLLEAQNRVGQSSLGPANHVEFGTQLRTTALESPVAPSQAATLSEGATQFGRMRTAAKFLKENRYFDGTELRSLTKSQRRDIFSGIDFSKPVGVRTLDRGTELLQDVRIGGKPGPWFREPGTSASQVGLWTGGRESIRFRTTLPTQVLESRARPITDFWSQRGFSVPTEGGGTQFYTFQGYKIWPY